MKKALNYFLTVLTIAIFALAFYIIIFGTIAKRNNKLLSVFGYSVPAVVTNSMDGDKPDSFKAGSFVVTKKVPYEDINEGDVIVFQGEDKLIIHRVDKINEDGSFITKGDNNDDPDDNPVTRENYQAKMIKHFSFLGLGTKIPSYQLTVLGIIVIFLFIYVIVQIFQLVIAIKEKKLKEIEEKHQKK